jgi:hypothetical protein
VTRKHDRPMMPVPPKRRPRVPDAPADAPWRVIIRRTRMARRRLAMLASHADLPPGPAVVFARTGREPTRKELETLTASPWSSKTHE